MPQLPAIAHKRPKAQLSLRLMCVCTSVLIVMGLGAQLRSMYQRKLALDELVAKVELSGKGTVSVGVTGTWKLLQHTGLDERWYFSYCFLGCKQADGNDGSFLATLSDSSLRVITEFEAVDNFYDKVNLLHVTRMTNLTVLNMNLSYLSDPILQSLDPAKLPLLAEVHVSSNGHGVTDRGIEECSIIPQLRILELNHCEGVTDKSVSALEKGTKLVDLSIERTGISEKGFHHLKQRLGSQVVSWRARN